MCKNIIHWKNNKLKIMAPTLDGMMSWNYKMVHIQGQIFKIILST